MNNEKSILIKEEQAEETCPEPTTMFLGDPLGGYWSTDHLNGDSTLNFGWDENENNNAVLNTLLHTILEAESECCPPPLLVPEKELFLDDPLGVYWSTDHINEDSKLNFGWDENENNNAVLNTLLHIILEAESECCPPPLLVPKKEPFPDDTFGISCQTDFIKEDPELNLEADETQNIMPNTSVVDHMETGWIKNDDETNEVCSMVPFSVTIKEELQENVNQEDLKDPLDIGEASVHVKQEHELKHHVDGIEHNALKDPLDIGEASVHVKQEHELKHHVDGFEHNVATSIGSESDNTRLIQRSSESCYIPSEETDKQEMVPGVLETGTLFGIHTEHTEEDNLFDPSLKRCLKENEFHTFSCNSCLQNFASKYRLIMHVFIHINGVQPPTYVCKSCGEVFCNNISLNRHVKLIAGVPAPFDDHNYNIGPIHIHENMVEGVQEVSFVEQSGNQSSNKETSMISRQLCNDNCNTHMTTSDVEKRDRHDNYRNSSVTGNVNHRAVILTYKCDRCGKGFTRLEHLKRHELIHAGITSHTCNICGKSFTLLGNLKRHSFLHTGSLSHKCDICGKSFTQLSNLKQHSLIHSGSTPHKCNTCGKYFTHLSNLKQHSLIHIGSAPHKCNTCGKSFNHLSNFKRHALIHTGIKPHKCDKCGNSFTRLSNLKEHSLIHTGSKPHKCKICGNSFTWLSDLKRHSIIHTGLRPHKCDICGKSFTQLATLKQHSLIHTGGKIHKCDICGISFKQLAYLKQHSLIHTGVKLHKCNTCGKSFTLLRYLKKHSAIHNGKTT